MGEGGVGWVGLGVWGYGVGWWDGEQGGKGGEEVLENIFPSIRMSS